MSEVHCALCGSEIPENSGISITLTPEEREALGGELSGFVYCAPCNQLMRNPITAASLMVNVTEGYLRALGVDVSQETLNTFKRKLLDVASRKKTT